MSSRFAGVLAGALVALSLAPAGAAEAPRLRLHASGVAYTDVVLPPGVELNERDTTFTIRRGTYAAWWVVRVGERPTDQGNQAGGVRWVDGDTPNWRNPSVTFGLGSASLAAGRYRVYVATDGQATIDVPAKGLGRGRDIRPNRATRAVAATYPLTVTPAGLVADDHRAAWTLPPNALAASSVRAVADPGAAVQMLTACLMPAGEDCDGPTTSQGYTTNPGGTHAVRLTAVYLPGTAPVGRADSVHRAKAGPRVVRASASVFYLVTVP